MGNGGVDGCCTGNSTIGGCCKSSASKKPDANAPRKPVSSGGELDGDVMGIRPQAPPGIGSLFKIGPDGDEKAEGDAAAGKSNAISCKDGSTYEGDLVDGLRHGHGVRKSLSSEYMGQWKGDAQHGQGSQRWADGRVYEGEFDAGKFAGQGRMVWSTQKGSLIYEGQYREDLKHGHGKFVWADGRTYEGEWCLGKRHGRGRYVNARLEQKVGYWLDDKFDRWEADDVNNNGAANPPVTPRA